MDFFEMIVTLNFKNFFEKTNRKFVARKDYSVREVDNIKNYLFELLNDGDDVIQISLFDYIKKYSAVYPILLSLERRGKLELLNVKIDWDRTVSEIYWKRWPKVIFEINPLVNEFLPEFHIDTEGLFLADEQDIHVCDFRE